MSRCQDILNSLLALSIDSLSKDDCNALLQCTLYMSTALLKKLETERTCPGLAVNEPCQAKKCNFDRKEVSADRGLICNACAKKRQRKQKKQKIQ